MQTEQIVCDSASVVRLDAYLSAATARTRNNVAKLISEGLVTVNGSVAGKSAKVKAGDIICYSVPPLKTTDVLPENIPLDIVFEDEHLLVVNKPKGMVVHPAAGNEKGTLVNALLYHCGDSLSGINGVARPGIVHRIDKNTSGLLMVAKTDEAHNFLAEQIKEHSFSREYEAVVYGNVKADECTVNAPIGRHKIRRKEMAVTAENSRDAVTHFKVINRYNGFTHIKCILETGRTHQIRVHSAYMGHPVAGDEVYGPRKVITELGGQCLHAKKLGFIHPATKQYMEFETELPEYFIKFINSISKGS